MGFYKKKNSMNKETFQKKWYYRLIQVIYVGALVSNMLSILNLAYDKAYYRSIEPGLGDYLPRLHGGEFLSFFAVWGSITLIAFWLIRKAFFYIAFGEPILKKRK
jgi:hypothetical protein